MAATVAASVSPSRAALVSYLARFRVNAVRPCRRGKTACRAVCAVALAAFSLRSSC